MNNLSPNLKKLIITLAVAAIAVLGWIVSELAGGGAENTPPVLPSPSPSVQSSPLPSSTPSSVVSASPSPSPSVSPVSSPSPSPTPSGLRFAGVEGEVVGQEWTSTVTEPVDEFMRAYEILQVETRIPSFKGARVGLYDDPLKPVTSLVAGKRYWIETTLLGPSDIPGSGGVGSDGKWWLTYQLGSFGYAIVKPGKMKTMPFYSELTHSQVGAAHGLPDDSAYQAARFAKTKLYMALLRAHGVEPIKQFYVSLPPIKDGRLDLDKVAFTGAKSFREMVLTGAIAAPMIVGPNLTNVPVDFIAALKASTAAGDLPPDAWAYAWDEGEGVVDDLALARAQLLKPTGLKVMETRNVTDPFKPYIDWFFPVVSAVQPAWYHGGFLGGAYVSCMSQGNCQPKASADQVASATGDPMMVLDAPAVHPRAFGWVLARLGAPRGLYFNTTQKLTSAWAPGGQYSEGGNGDGTLLYPGTDGLPWPSLRLKRIQRGLQDLWYLQRGGTNPVTSSRVWPKDESLYEAERLRVWEALP